MSAVQVVGLGLALALAFGQSDEQPTFSGTSERDQISVEAVVRSKAEPPRASGADQGGASVTPPIRRWRGVPARCLSTSVPDGELPVMGCTEVYGGIECEEGEQAVGALFEERVGSGGRLETLMLEDESCVPEHEPQVALPAQAARAFRQMQIEPSQVNVQPPDGWTLVNAETIVFTETAPRTMSTRLLGRQVEIRAVSSAYSWDFGDGSSPVVTSDPGAPYPAHTVAHTYTKRGVVTISLTTTWNGQFRLAGDSTWRDVPGEATTVSSSGGLEVLEARARLVEDLYTD